MQSERSVCWVMQKTTNEALTMPPKDFRILQADGEDSRLGNCSAGRSSKTVIHRQRKGEVGVKN